MHFVRCGICGTRLPTWRRLISHYMNGHSKLRLTREILKLSLLTAMPKIFSAKKRKLNTTAHRSEPEEETKKTETVFANDNIQILYRDNDIIIRDDKSSVDMEFSFDECSNETKDIHYDEVNNNTNNKKKKQVDKFLNLTGRAMPGKWGMASCSSSASSEDSSKKFSFRKKIRKKRDARDKTRHYKINITRMKNCEHLNEATGEFYVCECTKSNSRNQTRTKIINPGDLKLASDTESASETGKANVNDLKVFCSKCGNGYRDESLLMEHMKIHETHCRVCNQIFPTESLFKEHIETHLFKVFVCHICNYEFPVKATFQKHFESHLENSVLESIIDMEEDYKVIPCSLPNISYQNSINSIVDYLKKDEDLYNFPDNIRKIHCDICLSEVFYSLRPIPERRNLQRSRSHNASTTRAKLIWQKCIEYFAINPLN